MKTNKRSFMRVALAGAFAATACVVLSLSAQAQTLSPEEARQIAEDAYIYGYSLITTEVTRVQMSNVARSRGSRANGAVRQHPTLSASRLSRRFCTQCRYAVFARLARPRRAAGLQPSRHGRAILSVPDYRPMDVGLQEVAEQPHRRRTAANYLFTGPGWKGTVPEGMKHFPMPTRYMVILGRTYADGTEQDYKTVNALQAQYKITPLSAWGKSYTPVTPPVPVGEDG